MCIFSCIVKTQNFGNNPIMEAPFNLGLIYVVVQKNVMGRKISRECKTHKKLNESFEADTSS